jgi:hypothetical protein
MAAAEEERSGADLAIPTVCLSSLPGKVWLDFDKVKVLAWNAT